MVLTTRGGPMRGPLSVLYFSNTLTRGGAEEHIAYPAARAGPPASSGLSSFARPKWPSQLRSDLPGDVELIPLRLRKPGHLAAAFRLARIIRERRVDILHSHLFYGSLFASPIGWLCRVPLIIETPHVREQWRQGWFKSRFIVDRLVGRFVHQYIAVSEANARYLIKEKRLPARKITVIHNGCDIERFDPARPAAVRPSPEPRLRPAGSRLWSWPGVWNPRKGTAFCSMRFRLCCMNSPKPDSCAWASGSLRSELEARVRELGLGDSIRFVGHQSNIPDWLALADLTILPSFYEGLPLVAIESLAAGRPMVATAVDGTPEIVVDGETGLTVPPGDARALAQAICRLLGDPVLRGRLARRGREWVLERFSAEQQIRRTEILYRFGLERRGYQLPAPAFAEAPRPR